MKKGNMYKGQEKMLRTHAAGVGKKDNYLKDCKYVSCLGKTKTNLGEYS